MNVLRAMKQLIDCRYSLISQTASGLNRANTAGEALEGFVKDAFAGCIEFRTAVGREASWNSTFSYFGSANNPPDALVRGGVAIETKKLGSLKSDLALNSSYPKQKLRVTDSKISEAAISAEPWVEKDLVYAIGTVKGGHLKRLWLVYGDCLAADDSHYERVESLLSKLINEESGLRIAQTNEIANIREIDPLHRTILRVRGMWSLKNPNNVFEQYTSDKSRAQYYLLLREDKYQALPSPDRAQLEMLQEPGFKNRIINIPDPNDASRDLEARLFSYEF